MRARVERFAKHLQAPAASHRRGVDVLDVCIDYRSVWSYLMLPKLAALQADFGLAINWLPFCLKNQDFGIVAANGALVVQDLKPHWRKKNSHLLSVAREYGALRGITVDGLVKEVDSSLALLGMLWIKACLQEKSNEGNDLQVMMAYHTSIFKALWERGAAEFEVENVETIRGLVRDAVGDAHAVQFPDVLLEQARSLNTVAEAPAFTEALDVLQQQQLGARRVWSAPSFVLPPVGRDDDGGGEVFVGDASMALLRERLLTRHPEHPASSYSYSLTSRTGHPTSALILQLSPTPTPSLPLVLDVYIDIKSPYAFLALAPTFALQRDFHVDVNWLPFVLDIPSYLGSARVGKMDNKVQAGSDKRSPQQWFAVKYAYMDARRYASLYTTADGKAGAGLTLYGTQKIWDSSLWAIAMLWAKKHDAARRANDKAATSADTDTGVGTSAGTGTGTGTSAGTASGTGTGAVQLSLVERFHAVAWPPFWRRELDIEDMGAIVRTLATAGVPTIGFEPWARAEGEGRRQHDRMRDEAWHKRGVFGVPTYAFPSASGGGGVMGLGGGSSADNYWGREHLELLRLKLYHRGYAKHGRSAPLGMSYAWHGPFLDQYL